MELGGIEPSGPIRLSPSVLACSTRRRASSSFTTGSIDFPPAVSASVAASTAGIIESVTACPFRPDARLGVSLSRQAISTVDATVPRHAVAYAQRHLLAARVEEVRVEAERFEQMSTPLGH
jgi:hypothetical protein